jgi:tetratricopeptide (TPR) repeat protein/outer membrane protein assembly factor BamD (BamD/ComL family)
MTYGYRVLMALTLTLLCALAAQAQYVDDYKLEAALSRKLAEIQMFDFADLHMEHLRKSFSGDEALNVLEGEYYAAKGVRSKAVAAFEKIKRGSRYYPDACLARAKFAASTKEKIEAYEEFFGMVTNPPSRQDDCELYVKAILGLSNALKTDGKAAQAAKVLEKLDGVECAGGGEIDPRMMVILKSQVKLDAADTTWDETGKITPAQKTLVEASLKEMEKLLWSPYDMPAAMAYVESARAKILLGKPDEALDIIVQATSFLSEMEEALGRDAAQHSPLAGAYYYIARAFHAQGRSKNDTKLLTKALKKYYKVVEDYDKSALAPKALHQMEILKEAMGVEIQGGGNLSAQQQMKRDTADALYRKGELAKAADLYLEAAALNLKWRSVPETLRYAVSCLYKSKRYLEAEAIAELLGSAYPRSEDSQKALYSLGVALTKAAKEAKGQKLKDEYTEASVGSFSRFVQIAPTDPNAAMAAWRVAEYQYAKGGKMRDERTRLQGAGASTREVNDAILAMRAAYEAAIPAYKVLVENYGSTEYGMKALYKLGWVYRIRDINDESAKYFLKYCEVQDRPTEEKAISKFYAAEQLLRIETVLDDGETDVRKIFETFNANIKHYETVIGHYTELIEWLSKKNGFPSNDNTARYLQYASAMIGWCYDGQAAKCREATDWIDAKVEALNAPIEAAKAAAAAAAPPEPAEGEAPATAPAPAAIPELSPQEAALVKALEGARPRYEAIWKDRMLKAVEAFEAYADEHKNDEAQTAPILGKLGAIYIIELDDQVKGQAAFERLTRTFPNSIVAKESAFTLGRVYIKNGKWDKANEILLKEKENLGKYSFGNLYSIATKLWRDESKSEIGLDPELVLAANEAILVMARDPKHEDHADAKKREEKVNFQMAEVLTHLKQYDKTLAVYDTMMRTAEANKQKTGRYSAFYFDILFGQGDVYKAQGDLVKARKNYEQVLTNINAEALPEQYNHAVYEVGASMAATDNEELVKKSISRFMQIIQFSDMDKNPEIAPWVQAAYAGAAKSFALINNLDEASKLRKEYLQKFPRGAYRKQIMSLPSPKFF